MDAARLAAKMALAHQGLDIKAQKAESKRSVEAEPYVPQFYTTDESLEAGNEKETVEEEVLVPEGAIWDLSSRSNKNSPKQEIGTSPFSGGDSSAATIFQTGLPRPRRATV